MNLNLSADDLRKPQMAVTDERAVTAFLEAAQIGALGPVDGDAEWGTIARKSAMYGGRPRLRDMRRAAGRRNDGQVG